MKKKSLLLFTVCVLLFSCFKKKETNNNSGLSTIDTDSRIFPIVIMDSAPVLSDLRVYRGYKNAIFADLEIINISQKSVFLYKPLLPSDTSSEVGFVIFDNNVSNSLNDEMVIPFYKNNYNSYFNSGPSPFSAIKPVLNDSCFIEIRKGEKRVFTINLSLRYDFQSFLKKNKNVKKLQVNFHSYFPMLDDLHKLKYDTADENLNKIVRPIFFSLGYSSEIVSISRANTIIEVR